MTRAKKNRGKYEDNVRKTFILNFNKMASIYKEEEKLEGQHKAVAGECELYDGAAVPIIKRKKTNNTVTTKSIWEKILD
jgi:hypothetical protein